MMARCIGIAACLALLMATGCVCRGPNGYMGDPLACQPDCGPPCLPGLGYNRVWKCDPCDDCGPGGCGPMSHYKCGALPMLRAHLAGSATCGRGCGEVYWGEWVSDPPDCCDPCNSCGDWQGQQCCSPGLLKRIWWGAHGYKLGGQHGDANCCGGCNSCGGGGGAHMGGHSAGCATCGGGGHGDHGMPGGYDASGGAILNENWNNEPLPTTNQPIHKAQTPVSARVSQAPSPHRTASGPRRPTTMQPTPRGMPTNRVQRSQPINPQARMLSPRPWSPVAANQMR